MSFNSINKIYQNNNTIIETDYINDRKIILNKLRNEDIFIYFNQQIKEDNISFKLINDEDTTVGSVNEFSDLIKIDKSIFDNCNFGDKINFKIKFDTEELIFELNYGIKINFRLYFERPVIWKNR